MRSKKNLIVNINSHVDNSEYKLPFNLIKLHFALNSCQSKSPGPDDKAFIFIKNLSEKDINTLLSVYNIIWNKRIFPNQWRQALVIPILKPEKDKFDVLSYRPISLISTLSKLLEKMIQ